MLLARLGKWIQAGEIFSEAARQRLVRTKGQDLPDIAHLYTLAAKAYRMGGDKEGALASAREALKLVPFHPQGRFELAQAEKMS